MKYQEFLKKRLHEGAEYGFDPIELPDQMFDFQKFITEWAIRKGRGAIFADCGLGKGQPFGSRVLTPNGWVAIETLSVEDLVTSSSGGPSKVVGVFPKEVQNTYRFYFSDDSSFVVDEDHLHICRTNNDRQRGRPWRVISTKELLECGNLRYGEDGKSRNYDIPVVGDVQFNSGVLPIDPYIIGVLLGDGYLGGNVSITSADDDVINAVAERLPAGVQLKYTGRYNWHFITGLTGCVRHPFRQSLYDLGLLGKGSYDKYVPDAYLFASPEDRLAVLRGLMDTDGYIASDGCCQFYSVSPMLSEAVVFLVRSLGGVPTQSVKKASYNGKLTKDCYVVTFSLATHNPFLMERKARRWNPTPRDNGRWIDRVEYEGRQKTICIAVDSVDESYVTEQFIVTHNTSMQLSWADNVHRHTNKPVLVLTPLAVSTQTISEGDKFGIECARSRDGKVAGPITVTNYEQLHRFDPSDFAGVVCDESSVLKSFDSVRKSEITKFMRKMEYRLLCTATAAPNDYIELGTSSEALGFMGYMDMLNRFFKNDQNNSATRRMHGEAPKWRLKGHAELPFWRWVCSWALVCRKPSDLGFDDDDFELPALNHAEHVVKARQAGEGRLFDVPATNLHEQRKELRRTLKERCEKAATLVNDTGEPALVWCHLNDEGDLLERLIPDAVQVSGRDSDEVKERKFAEFINGDARVLVTKAKIGAWGLNLQHCAHVVMFPSHSYESYYQGIRRCWRFGQTRDVQVDIVLTEGGRAILENLRRKATQADRMFDHLVAEMNNAKAAMNITHFDKSEELPAWL